MAAKLTHSAVEEILQDCLSDDQTFPVKGIVGTYCFNIGKLEEHCEQIVELLLELPDVFMMSKGGGGSFLQACYDKHGNHWGEHLMMEALFCLGQALGLVTSVLPRELWSALPGGMPYYCVKDTA